MARILVLAFAFVLSCILPSQAQYNPTQVDLFPRVPSLRGPVICLQLTTAYDRDCGTMLNRLALFVSSEKKHEYALQQINIAIALLPSALSYNSRAVIYGRMDNLAQAERDATKAVGMDPKAAVAWDNLATIRFKQEKYQESLDAINQAIKLRPHLGIYYSQRAAIYKKLGRYEMAIEDEKTAELHDPTLRKKERDD